MSGVRLVLASASPRRRELLDQLGVTYTCDPADIDESLRENEAPADYVQRMAQEKARVVFSRYSSAGLAVLAADTSVVVDGAVLGKPHDKTDALKFLACLSGRTHDVLTAVCLGNALGLTCEVVATQVEFIELSPRICAAYIATDEPWDKAGAYAIQGFGAAFVRSIKGSYSNVVGLPLCETWQMLRAVGIPTALAKV